MILYVRSIYIAIIGLWRFLVVFPFLATVTGVATVCLLIGLPIAAFFSGGGAALAAIMQAIIFDNVASTDMGGAITDLASALKTVLFIFGCFASWLLGAAGIYMGLVAIRTSLMAEGMFNPVDLVKLLKVSVKYSFFFLLANVALGALALFAGYMLFFFGYTDLPADLLDRPDALTVFFSSRTVTLIAMIYAACALILYAAMMVPMAASAWSASERMQPYDLFYGFGSGFLGILLVLVTVTAIQYYFGYAVELGRLLVFATGWMFAKLSGDDIPVLEWIDLKPMLIGAGVSILLYYWQYVAAALGFIQLEQKRERARIEAGKRPRSEIVDAAELRRARASQQSIWH